MMKLSFESNLDYQCAAVKAVTDLFTGQQYGADINYDISVHSDELNLINGVGNSLGIGESTILSNLRKVQTDNGITPSECLDGMNFSVEMETGTGKHIHISERFTN